MTSVSEWEAIEHLDDPVPAEVIDRVNAILFAPDPPVSDLSGVEVCVILGSRNCGYKAERAAQLFAGNDEVVFVACGANPTSSGEPEAELIRGILLEHGIADYRVLIDEHSTNTAGNLFHAERLISQRGVDLTSTAVAIVSSGFHRRHVFANLPPALSHSLYVSATGPNTGPETWHSNAMGRAVILHELRRPDLSVGRGFRYRPDSET